MNFKDKVFLITGSTSGIGQGIAKALLEEGAKVVINYAHNEENAEETRKLFKQYKDKTLFIKADISDKPMEGSVAYCTSEAATIMLTKMCVLELTKKYNIKTNTVSPSMTLTPFAKKSYTEEEIKQTSEKNPSGRLGEVEDTVNAVLFLLSEQADYINGENLNVNGGILLV